MLTWLQEYTERLGIADVPPPNPPLDTIQQDLIEAYAAQSRATWEGMTTDREAGGSRLPGRPLYRSSSTSGFTQRCAFEEGLRDQS